MAKRAMITGITGQDGSYLAELLLEKGYEVYGLVRQVRGRDFFNISHMVHKLKLWEGYVEYKMNFPEGLDEVYNLAAASFVGTSWDEWKRYLKVNGMGAVYVYEAALRSNPKVRIYQASSSEMFGNVSGLLSEEDPFVPRSPYGASKVYAHNMARIYRESHGAWISCGICFNHESPRRGPEFVSRKIAKAVAAISRGTQKEIAMGSLHPHRDWGHAKDYVRAMWLMLQDAGPQDYVVATGESRNVGEFLALAFSQAGLRWDAYYVKDPKFIRPAEVFHLRGDASKIKVNLGWAPEYTFEDLVREMVLAEMGEVYDDKPKRETPTDVQP